MERHSRAFVQREPQSTAVGFDDRARADCTRKTTRRRAGCFSPTVQEAIGPCLDTRTSCNAGGHAQQSVTTQFVDRTGRIAARELPFPSNLGESNELSCHYVAFYSGCPLRVSRHGFPSSCFS